MINFIRRYIASPHGEDYRVLCRSKVGALITEKGVIDYLALIDVESTRKHRRHVKKDLTGRAFVGSDERPGQTVIEEDRDERRAFWC